MINRPIDPSARRHRPVVLGLALAACLGACKKPEPTTGEAPGSAAPAAAPKTAVTLQLNWTPEPEFGGFYAAVHDKLY